MGVLLLGALLVGLRLARSGVLPGVRLAGHQVGGMSEAQLRDFLTELESERARSPVTLVRPKTAGTGETSVNLTRARLGYDLDVDATVARAMALGRQGNPVAALADHLGAFVGTSTVGLVTSVDADRLGDGIEGVSKRLIAPPREGDLRFSGAHVARVSPIPGARVDVDAVVPDVRAAVLAGGERRVTVATEAVEPLTSDAEVRRVYVRARRALSAPVRLTRDGGTITVTPSMTGRVLDARLVDDEDDARLELVANADRLATLLVDQLAAVESDPVDADVQLVGDEVRVQPGHNGFGFDAATAAEQLLRVATRRGDRSAVLRGEVVRPEFTTAEARDLDITERVSSFTTYHDCCEPRVENIHTIANIIDGAIVAPGETFSINDYVGPRTTADGFVKAPAILEGEYIEEVGGGVSQFATTMFNAIFFGGYDLLEYKPHSYYIDRYPRGREATVSYPAPDLAFLNDSDAAIYIDTSYTDTSITVTFYGHNDVEVNAVMGQPYNYRSPSVEREVNRSLPKGSSQVVQSGTQGFEVDVQRVLVYPSGDKDVESFHTTYLPEPRIIERNPR